MNTIAWMANAQNAWSRFLRFIIVIEESMDRDFVTPLNRRVDALEREIQELRVAAARAAAASSEKIAS